MADYGLIGYPLGHSYSKKYFEEKFAREKIKDSAYRLLELPDIKQFPDLLKRLPNLRGLNVTIPHKQTIIPFLSELDPAAAKIGAVNTIKVNPDGKLTGYNTDWLGFRNSLLNFIPDFSSLTALILGTGGSSKAVAFTLDELKIPYRFVSREPKPGQLSYFDLSCPIIQASQLIINTTPAGMYPNIEKCPDLPYDALTPDHYLFDLVYNPEETLFLKKGKEAGGKTRNGLEMLELQAEEAWGIWQG